MFILRFSDNQYVHNTLYDYKLGYYQATHFFLPLDGDYSDHLTSHAVSAMTFSRIRDAIKIADDLMLTDRSLHIEVVLRQEEVDKQNELAKQNHRRLYARN